ncbi:unnamed protein product [Adineta steineri]|nr:unnamed protein product [Adineta steineri]
MKMYGLWTHYLNDDDLYRWIKKMMAISMLPVSKMLKAFQYIEKETTTDRTLKQFLPQLKQMLVYYKKQWLPPGMIAMNLLQELIRFIELPPKKVKGVGVDNGEIFKKENGRQISSSHRYWGVLEPDGIYNLYKKFKGGPLDNETWLILRIKDESYRTIKFILEHAKIMGDMPRIRDVEDYFKDERILVCRDRIQMILNHFQQQEKQNPTSNNTISVAVAHQIAQSQLPFASILSDTIDGVKSSKKLPKPATSNDKLLVPLITPVAIAPQEQPDTIDRGTPMRDRLRKRKTTAPPATKGENNTKSVTSGSSRNTTSSEASKKRRPR